MTALTAFLTPHPPDWRLDWDELNGRFSWIRDLVGCPQEPEFHGEGDVWIHLRMVCESLVAMPSWQARPEVEREIIFAAALLHDVAKPACTREESGRITSRGHSRRGAIMARRLLWAMNVTPRLREEVVGLVRHHQVPFYLIDRPDSQRLAFEVSQTARCNLLSILAEADARGRVTSD